MPTPEKVVTKFEIDTREFDAKIERSIKKFERLEKAIQRVQKLLKELNK